MVKKHLGPDKIEILKDEVRPVVVENGEEDDAEEEEEALNYSIYLGLRPLELFQLLTNLHNPHLQRTSHLPQVRLYCQNHPS